MPFSVRTATPSNFTRVAELVASESSDAIDEMPST